MLRDYCEDATFTTTCKENEVAVMQEAWYGRMEVGDCLSVDYGNIGCSR